MLIFNRFKKLIFRIDILLRKDCVLIYQMGKVGSSTIEFALNNSPLYAIHIHSFGEFDSYKIRRKSWLSRLKNKMRALLFKIILRLRRRPLKIITLMRDPVARNLSALFQELPTMLYLDSLSDNRRSEPANQMLNRFLDHHLEWDVPFNWFDHEFKRFIGLNVFEFSFDRTKGMGTIKDRSVEVLLLTSEKLKNNRNAVSNFLDYNLDFSKSTNESKNKWYGGIYKDYLAEFCLDEEELDHIYNSKVVRHFYETSDIEKMKLYWGCPRKKAKVKDV